MDYFCVAPDCETFFSDNLKDIATSILSVVTLVIFTDSLDNGQIPSILELTGYIKK